MTASAVLEPLLDALVDPVRDRPVVEIRPTMALSKSALSTSTSGSGSAGGAACRMRSGSAINRARLIQTYEFDRNQVSGLPQRSWNDQTSRLLSSTYDKIRKPHIWRLRRR